MFAVVAKIVGFAAGWCAALPCKAGASTVSSDPGGDPPTAVSIAPASTFPGRVRIGDGVGLCGRRVRGPEPGKQRRHQQQLPDVTAGACASAAAATSTAAAVATNNNSGGAD